MLGALGLAVSGAGSLLGAFGASKSAKAQKKASKEAIRDINALYDRQSKNLDTLITGKEDKLYNLGDIFERFESTGAFGDTDTLKNLRQAQSDFSALAAGDFGAFESQLRKSLSDTLINTVGAGAPVGTFAGLAADKQMDYRLQGIQTGMSISDFMASQSQNLLGLEFGIMDQRFNTGYQMDANKVNAINEARMVGAKTAGIGMTGFGNALSGIGSGMFSYDQFNRQMDTARSMPKGFDAVDYFKNSNNYKPVSFFLNNNQQPSAIAQQEGSYDWPPVGDPGYNMSDDSLLPNKPGTSNLPDAFDYYKAKGLPLTPGFFDYFRPTVSFPIS